MFQPNNMFGNNNQLLDMVHQAPENEMGLIRGDDESVGDQSGDEEQDPNQPSNKKKRYHRHTQQQIREMESFFKDCPHPDDKQRKELGRRLNLEPLQVKFWFQNKRTQMKSQHERHENSQLRNENERLRAENMRYKDALRNATCPTCGGPATVGDMSLDEQNIRIENIRLREEIDRISATAAKYVSNKPVLSYPHLSVPVASRAVDLGVGNLGPQTGLAAEAYGSGDLLSSPNLVPTEAEKPMVIELAVAAMEELVRMAHAGEPLWMSSTENSLEGLNEDEYMRTFACGLGPKPLGLKTEASRESAVVIMNPMNLVKIFMDVNQWTSVFSSIVSRAITLDVFSTGVAGNYNGALQVMTAEIQVPSPVVPTREIYFVRYCKQHADGIWAVVDVSLDSLRPNIFRSRRRPSGCLIQDLANGYSKVTWVEHVEIDDRNVHTIYKPLVNSGVAFGARRWVTTLDRQCERLARLMANNMPPGDTGVIPEGRKSMLKLAERMVMSFYNGVGASTTHTWTLLSGNGDDVRIMTRKSINDPGRPPGIVISASTALWLPVLPKRIFDFFTDLTGRNEWDILSNGGHVQEIAYIASGRDPGNSVSLIRVRPTQANQPNMLILQESIVDSTGFYIVYAPVDVVAMNVVLGGGDPNYVALLPSGFAILPDGPNYQASGVPVAGSGGTLITVAFQILVDSTPTAKLTLGAVTTVTNLISCTIEKIKGTLLGVGA
ncbi:hypothetical protein RD792_002730 [Penstemon davidsonii]|uniref:Uncharacterized protein n=1 Tax=Penstemon davidsonii TaxID=160366 RepID=A0ABR0DS32_9LAMI|nr:hypothetical protein RD792_002730 [Penstemon davidsonii]